MIGHALGRPVLLATTLLLLAACKRETQEAQEREREQVQAGMGGGPTDATMSPGTAAPFTLASGSEAGGVAINNSPDGLVLRLGLAGLPPGVHGIHLHAIGKCDAPSFDSAGAHWSPTIKQHGLDNPQGPHMGDLPNITVGADGTLQQAMTLPLVTPAMVADADGTALIIDADPDDNRTDPDGNSGARIACAIVAPPGTVR